MPRKRWVHQLAAQAKAHVTVHRIHTATSPEQQIQSPARARTGVTSNASRARSLRMRSPTLEKFKFGKPTEEQYFSLNTPLKYTI
jgi:hypothetical protein